MADAVHALVTRPATDCSGHFYTDEEVHNVPPQRPVYAPDHHVVHNAYPELATYLIGAFQAAGFDLNDLQAWPENVWMETRQGSRSRSSAARASASPGA